MVTLKPLLLSVSYPFVIYKQLPVKGCIYGIEHFQQIIDM